MILVLALLLGHHLFRAQLLSGDTGAVLLSPHPDSSLGAAAAIAAFLALRLLLYGLGPALVLRALYRFSR